MGRLVDATGACMFSSYVPFERLAYSHLDHANSDHHRRLWRYALRPFHPPHGGLTYADISGGLGRHAEANGPSKVKRFLAVSRLKWPRLR